MNVICINSRDELNLIDLDEIAYIKADGNYTNIVYIEGAKAMLSIGISQVEEIIAHALTRDGGTNSFVRLGRSAIINNRYLSQISLPKQQLILSDCGRHVHKLSVGKQLLKSYKDLIRNQYS